MHVAGIGNLPFFVCLFVCLFVCFFFVIVVLSLEKHIF